MSSFLCSAMFARFLCILWREAVSLRSRDRVGFHRVTPSTLLGPFCGVHGWPPTGGCQDTRSSWSAARGEHVLSSAGSVLGMGQLHGRTCLLGALLATGKCFPGGIVTSPPPGAMLLLCWVFLVLAEGWDSSGGWRLCTGHVGVPCWEVFIQTRCPVLWRLSFLPH